MSTGSDQLPPVFAIAKNAEAVKLIVGRKHREALRVLNEAIYASPEYPHSYANRAIVFERLGMAPQAEGDRQRARHLAEEGGYSVDDVFADPFMRPRRTAARQPAPPRPPPPQRRNEVRVPYPGRGRRFVAMSETAVVLVALGGLAAIALGLYLAADTVQSVDVNVPNLFDFDTFQEETPAEATIIATPPPTPEPTPPPVTPAPEALAGSPYSFSRMQEVWKSKGMETTLGAVNNSFSGFKVTPFDVTLSRGGASAAFFVFIYPDRNGPSQDWNLGEGVSPQGGRRAPGFQRGWYNSNVILLLRSGSEPIANDAKAAFLEL
jgi:hypothetical protein